VKIERRKGKRSLRPFSGRAHLDTTADEQRPLKRTAAQPGKGQQLMADIILVAVTLAFIAICVGYVNWCDRIIGPDDFGKDPEPTAAAIGESAPETEVEVPA
jgi:hypothetical protein